MKTIDENHPQSRVEVIKKCPKCGEEYSVNFTPRDAADWRVIYDNIGADAGDCQKCAYSFVGTPIFYLPCDRINCVASYNHRGDHVIVTF